MIGTPVAQLRPILEKADVSDVDIRQLEDALKAYQSTKARPSHKMPRIVCTGIYNAGKSTLLNALLGEDEKFPTGDIPTTKALTRAEANGVVYIDTPGLNAAEEDDQETQAAYETADFILFVSNAQSGGISEAEARWLQCLKERYTAESLKQRLIYVLTHGHQVDPEQLPAIEEKFQSDFEKAVGFMSQQVFWVDSITYQDGKAQNEALLIEYSGIPALQKALAEQLAGAVDVLEQACKTELNARQRELLECLGKVRLTLENCCDTAKRKRQKQLEEVDAAWAEFENNLKAAMPGKLGSVVYGHINLPRPSPRRQYGDAKSESEAKRNLESCLSSTYNAREQVLRKQIRENMTTLRPQYCSTGLDSAYFSKCNTINQLFEQTVLKFQQLGLSGLSTKEISVSPNLPSDLANQIEHELADNVVQTSGYYSLSKYIDMYCGIHNMGHQYKSGLFGIQVEVPLYTYEVGDAIWQMEKDMNEAWSSNEKYARNIIERYWESFCKELSSEVEKCKTALKKQVDIYRTSLAQSNESESLIAVLAHLDQIKQEVEA